MSCYQRVAMTLHKSDLTKGRELRVKENTHALNVMEQPVSPSISLSAEVATNLPRLPSSSHRETVNTASQAKHITKNGIRITPKARCIFTNLSLTSTSYVSKLSNIELLGVRTVKTSPHPVNFIDASG